MDFIKYRYIYYPVLFIVLFFLLDKIFLLPEVRRNFIQPGGMLYYYQRNQMLSDYANIKSRNKNKKTAIVLGDSRSFALGNFTLSEKHRKKWNIINFAGPQAVPAYQFYITEKLISIEKPDAIILGLSPDGFNENSPFFITPVLTFGTDAQFIRRAERNFSSVESQYLISSRRYALSGMNFSLKDLLKRISGNLMKDKKISKEVLMYAPLFNDFLSKAGIENQMEKTAFLQSFFSSSTEDLSQYKLNESPRKKIIDLGQGAYYAWFGSATQEQLKEETEKIVRLYLGRFEVSDVQMNYYKSLLELASEAGIQVLVFIPPVNPHLREIYAGEKKISDLSREIIKLGDERGAQVLDLNQNSGFTCSHYYDASHLSSYCFYELSEILFRNLDVK